MGIVVAHLFDGMSSRDIVEFHEVGHLWVSLDLPGGFRGLFPGRMISRRSPLSSFSRISCVFGRMASLLVADEALSVSDVLSPFTRREIDLVYVHSIGIRSRGSASRQDIAIPSFSEFPESYYVSVEFSCFVKPLFLFPTSLCVWEGGGSHHNSELLGYSSLEGIY